MTSANISDESGSQTFIDRHVGPTQPEIQEMLSSLGYKTLPDFIERVVPPALRMKEELHLSRFPVAHSEESALARISSLAKQNQVNRSYIGMGYSGTFIPTVILRNILENPGWYTQYTPYQPEISQGRLEALINFQTMITDLTAMDVANASLLDESTAAAEAMALALAQSEKNGSTGKQFFISKGCHPQTVSVVTTRAEALGVKVSVASESEFVFTRECFGALLQYPDTFGSVQDYRAVIERAHKADALVIMACDLLALTLLTPPGELGADVAVGSAQRFGVPMGYGGPHAAYFACRDEFKRLMPGRLVGVSKDVHGKNAYRLALQTREQHIRREKATSNICTAQVLLAIIASMYAVYHGPGGLRSIATQINRYARKLAAAIKQGGLEVNSTFFDTLTVKGKGKVADILKRAKAKNINLREIDDQTVSVALDETVKDHDLSDLIEVFLGAKQSKSEVGNEGIPKELMRSSPYLSHPVFNAYHSETEFLRYIRRLESRDLSLGTAMIPLGSCTMKLNATSEMIPVTWSEFGALHPFVSSEQARGYAELFRDLEIALQEVTGFDAVSLQPNAGSQGEYAGLLAIKAYHAERGEKDRDICLIPRSAHGTNPASASMAGLTVVVVNCDEKGNVELSDLKAKIAEHGKRISCLMLTYPSTHGVFEEAVQDICKAVHSVGAQVYMDGANLNALVGLCRPADLGADVCHINLHKTFCIPHGGGGPGMGPIGVRKHLAPHLPGHPIVNLGHSGSVGPVSEAPWGSASILVIPWMYLAMMSGEGLKRATEIAILNANYVANRLKSEYPVMYVGKHGFVAHECILDLRQFKKVGIEVEDVAKRLMDYNFHAPTISFPVPGTMMVEPTESESKQELDRFCEAMLSIREEIREIESGQVKVNESVLKNAPHTAADVTRSEWNRPYSREQAAFPSPMTRDYKFWPAVGRIDAAYGDRNLFCTCPPIGE